MIENWNHFISRFMASLRSNALGQFIMVLLTPWYSQENDTKNYVVQKKLETATPWSVIMLEHLISQRVGYTISIVLGDGQPINFYINGAKAEDMNYISAIINKHKLAGVSFDFSGSVFVASWVEPVCAVEQVGVQARWINPVCVKQDAISSAKWINPICVTELVSVSAKWANPICAKKWEDDTIEINVKLTWIGGLENPGVFGGIKGEVKLLTSTNSVVDTRTIGGVGPVTGATISFSPLVSPTGYKISLQGVKSYVDGVEMSTICVWDTSNSFDEPKHTEETHLIKNDTTIFVRVH